MGRGRGLQQGRVAWVFCVGVAYEGGGVACSGGRGHTGMGVEGGAWLAEGGVPSGGGRGQGHPIGP